MSDYLNILHRLQNHHALFSEFWSVGTIVEANIKTAAIEFDDAGNGVRFLIDPKFWAGLDDNEKAFVIAHECLHVYFEHGRRFHAMAKGKTQREKRAIFGRGNKAGDVVINHYLEDVFGFKREDMHFHPLDDVLPDGQPIRGVDRLYWLDTLFPAGFPVDANRSMEYYYSKLVELEEKQKQEGEDQDGEGGEGGGKPSSGGSGKGMTLDDHGGMNDESEDESKDGKSQGEREKQIQEFIDELTRRISDDELEDFEKKVGTNTEETTKAQQAGNIGGNMVKRIRLGRIVKKRKWETVIQEVLGRFKGKERDITIEQWAHKHRRLGAMSGNLLLPSELDDVRPIRDRIDVWFFQDTSGSCVSYAERFFKAAASIPEDRFKIRGFCFDTRVFEVDFKKCELQGFGGTCFRVIEERIQQIIKDEKCKYPQAVFLITDGYGSAVTPEFPDRWHWFLTENTSYAKQYVHAKSKSYQLSDFE